MRILFLLCFVLVDSSYGSITGSGSASIGMSQLQDATEYGADLDYQLDSVSVHQKTMITLSSEYTSSDSELSLFNDHSRLYSGDLASVSMQNSIPIFSSNSNWNTDSNFDSKKLSFLSDKRENWFWKTGPDYKKYIRRDLIVEVGFKGGESNLNGFLSKNTESKFLVTKIVSNNKIINASYNYNCWEYAKQQINEQPDDNCRLQYGVSLNVISRNSVIDIGFGKSLIDKSVSNTYGFKYDYKINSRDKLSFNIAKETGNLESRLDVIDAENFNLAEISTETKKIEYTKHISRASLLLFYEEVDYQSDQANNQYEEIRNVEIKYSLSESICRSCDVILTHKINKINELSWYMNAIGMDYPISRNILLNITLRHSKDEELGEFNSLNLQVRYSGMDQKLGQN